jgi:nitroimidazol reductase NimA-like FMN-containing flavoprotein (pyridoxamine 5'-phosphate oxidase superfamily)
MPRPLDTGGDGFPVSDRNRLRRLHERGRYDRASIYPILDAAMICHIAYIIDGQPYCTPTAFWREGDHLYWHGSSASRMLRSQRDGLPVCLTVTHLDSLVLARCGFNHSVDYRSAMCFGTARIIDDPEEKSRALDRMILAERQRCDQARRSNLRRQPSSVWRLTRRPARSAPRVSAMKRRIMPYRSTRLRFPFER